MVKQHHSPSVCYYIGEGAPYYGVITYHYYMLKKLGSNSFVFIYLFLFLFYLFIWILVWVCDDDGCGYGGGDRFLRGVVATTVFFFFFFLFLAMGFDMWVKREKRETLLWSESDNEKESEMNKKWTVFSVMWKIINRMLDKLYNGVLK